jgi:enamine deaminase RidA (YjgF/YER057c/UK114 family)
MAGRIERRLGELGLALPPLARSVGLYVPAVRTGHQLWCVQGPLWGDELRFVGRVGRELGLAEAQDAARLVCLNILAQLRAACDGDLERISRCIRLGGFVNSTPAFNAHTEVMNAASSLIVELFGERGRHARFAVGCASLPYDLAVEIEGVFEVAG